MHDDACHLCTYATSRAAESSEAQELAQLKFVIDEFHMAGHTDPWCLANCHPRSPEVAQRMEGVRTSVCEFTFTWMSQYRHQTKHVTEHSFKWFLMEMFDEHNAFIFKGKHGHLPKAVRRDE